MLDGTETQSLGVVGLFPRLAVWYVGKLIGALVATESLQASSDQRAQILATTDRLTQTGDRIKESKRTLIETEELGVSILQDLHQQRQSLLHARDTVSAVVNELCRMTSVTVLQSECLCKYRQFCIGQKDDT